MKPTRAYRTPLVAYALRYASRLRFPQLFLCTALLFLVDLVFPDVIPFADEVLLGLLTLLLGSWKKRSQPGGDDSPA